MAFTERYTTSAGAGAHDGTSEANAFSWTEMVTDWNAGSRQGYRYNLKGNVTLAADAVFTGDGTISNPIVLRGYSSTIGDLDALQDARRWHVGWMSFSYTMFVVIRCIEQQRGYMACEYWDFAQWSLVDRNAIWRTWPVSVLVCGCCVLCLLVEVAAWVKMRARRLSSKP